MSLNKSTGNMFDWATHTWNPIRGKCPHKCTYCYMRGKPVGDLRLDKKALKDSLGLDGRKTIFVGSSVDMWAYGEHGVPAGWIGQVLRRCREFPNNTYAFLTKNPMRYETLFFEFPPNTMLGITLETDEYQDVFTEAPDPVSRAASFASLPEPPWNLTKFVSVEPIMDFSDSMRGPGALWELIKNIDPAFVSIGADSKGRGLPEPSAKKILGLVERLSEFTEVRIKDNMKRLLGGK